MTEAFNQRDYCQYDDLTINDRSYVKRRLFQLDAFRMMTKMPDCLTCVCVCVCVKTRSCRAP